MAIIERFKKIDLMKIIPDKLKESSYLGLTFSILFVLITICMIINQLSNLLSTNIESELLIDHLKDDKDMSIYLDIIFPNYPCGLVSLDKMDVVHSHIVDVEENLKKMRIDQNMRILGQYRNNMSSNRLERVEVITEQVKNNEGCRIKGDFRVKLVPGNFHISFHNYVPEFQGLLQKGLYEPDFSHIIKTLEFGFIDSKMKKRIKSDFKLRTLHTLNKVEHLNLKKELGFPHGITHNINIVPSKFEYSKEENYEMFQYTSTTLKIVGGSLRVTFKFEIENFYMNFKIKKRNYSHFFIQTMAIIGGFYTIVMIFKMFLEDGVLNMAFKRRIGKIE